MVPFETFWSRLKEQLSQLPTLASGARARTVRKWSQFQGYFDGEFAMLYSGGNVITCETATMLEAIEKKPPADDVTLLLDAVRLPWLALAEVVAEVRRHYAASGERTGFRAVYVVP